MEFHLTRQAREKYKFDQSLFSYNGSVIFADFKSVREFVYKVNQQVDQIAHPEKAIQTSQLNGMGLMDEIFHYIFSLYRYERNHKVLNTLLVALQNEFGSTRLDELLGLFVNQYPPLEVYQNNITAFEYLSNNTDGVPHQELLLEDLILLWVSTKNPALKPFSELIWDSDLLYNDLLNPIMNQIEKSFSSFPGFGPENQNLIEMLQAPAKHIPHSITGQLEYIREHWGFLLGDILYKLLTSLDLAKEEEKLGFMGPGQISIPLYDEKELLSSSGQFIDIEAFSEDKDWMPRLVLIAKNVFVWLDQLSKKYGRVISRLDQIPDSELEELNKIGITGLWLIGLWQRSPASARIKQLCGNPEAVSSAYSLYTYRIADTLGGDEACERLKEKAANYGIRLASDMVPNHMGIDSEWVIQHPEWFLSVDECPFPSYSFTGPDLSSDSNILIQIEDHYYERTDAAVVFRRVDKRTGQTKFIYHGNDGTSMPWNDTAQLNYLDPAVREVVIQTILQVARRFPIIRFDAAMTLAKKHIQRLWYPEPGSGGAIPSRSEYAFSKADFDHAIPKEFWREVVERIESEVPDTLLLAEAFWLMEGYFVRTLGMHRVYNSAFMHMLRNEDNAGYRTLMKNTIEFEPEILKRFVNFMNNPDERTAVEQFGSGDKYFGICTLMTTMPGLPMFGHGQIEGFTEKYGMEYSKAFYEEQADQALVNRHTSEIFPLLYRRELFAGVDHFDMYDFFLKDGQINENIYAFTNQLNDQRTLVLYNNFFQETQGNINWAIPQSDRKQKTNRNIVSSLGLRKNETGYIQFHDLTTGLFFIRPIQELVNNGFEFHLNGYEHHVFVDFKLVHSDASHNFDQLFIQIGQSGVSDINQALSEIWLQPVLHPLREIINPDYLNYLSDLALHPQNYDLKRFNSIDGKIEDVLNGVKELSKVRGNHQDLQKEISRLFNALLQLLQLQSIFSAQGTRNVEKLLSLLGSKTIGDKNRWFTLLSWTVISRIGKIASSRNPIETSLAWMEEWKLDQPLVAALHTQGFSDWQVQRSLSSLWLAIKLQNWYKNSQKKTVIEILQEWFAITEVQIYLKFNRFENKLWYDHDAFQEFLWWMEIIPILQEQSEPNSNRVSIAETVLGVHEIIKKIQKLDKQSTCQVEKLIKIEPQ